MNKELSTPVEPARKMKYQVVREEHGKLKPLMQCDFEDVSQFKLITSNPQYKIFCNGKDTTKKYRRGAKGG